MPRRVLTRHGGLESAKESPRREEPGPVPQARTAVLYARVSTKDQEREGYSIPAQQALLRAYATEKGYRVLEEYVDVETAKRAGRTSFTQMLAWLRRHRSCRVLLVEKTDRLYRNLKDWVTIDEMEIEVHFVKEGVVLSDDSRSTDKFMHGIRVLMAKNYIDNLSEEVRKGMRQKAEEGYWPNPAPLGYLVRREGGQARLAPDPERAPHVRQLFELYDAGRHSLADLKVWAEQAGFRSRKGKPLLTSTLHWVLRNPIYAGRFIWGGRLYQGKDPTLISWELFERVQERMDGHPYTRASEHQFAFTGLLTCGHCGAAITAEIKKKRYTYYRCARNCTKEAYVREERLAEMFAGHFQKLHLPAPWLQLAVDALKDSRTTVKADVEARTELARKHYDRLGQLIDRAYEDKLEGRIDDAFFARKRGEWEVQRSESLHEMERLHVAERADIDLAVLLIELGNQAYERFIRLERPDQRLLIDLALSNSQISAGRLTVTWREPFSFLVNLADETPNEEPPSEGSEGGHTGWWAILDSNQ